MSKIMIVKQKYRTEQDKYPQPKRVRSVTDKSKSAKTVIAELRAIADPQSADGVLRFFKGDDPKTHAIGVPFGQVFNIAKTFVDLPLDAVEELLESKFYEVRMAAVSILDFKARKKSLPEAERKAVFDLYLRRHDRINNWGMVDRAAPHVVGEYLVDKDRKILDKLARSPCPAERRTAIVSTHAFIKRGETDDTFRIASQLVNDEDEYVQKAIASWVREAGKRDKKALINFLQQNINTLPKPTVTAAAKMLSDGEKQAIISRRKK